MRHFGIILTLAAVALLTTGCMPDFPSFTVEPDQLYGKWQKESTQEYWRYNTDGTGVTWDESEDVSEEESNLTFDWTLGDNVLTHVFTGAMDNQAVPKVYTVTYISDSSMSWRDDYGLSYNLTKVES